VVPISTSNISKFIFMLFIYNSSFMEQI